MANSTNTPAQAPAQTGNLKIKWILITIGICLLCILFTYLLKPTYAANSSRLAIKTDKSLNEARLLLEIESNSKYRFISSFRTNKKSKAVVFEAAEETAKKIEKLSKKILSLRILLSEESGGIYALEKNKSKWDEMGFRKIKISRDSLLDGTPVGFKNRSASNKIFITNGELKKLKAEITKTRNELFELMDNLVKVSENTEGVIFRYNDVNNRMSLNTKSLEGFTNITQLNDTRNRQLREKQNFDTIVHNSDIVVLQKNYSYLLWSILAIGTVIVSMNVVRK